MFCHRYAHIKNTELYIDCLLLQKISVVIKKENYQKRLYSKVFNYFINAINETLENFELNIPQIDYDYNKLGLYIDEVYYKNFKLKES